MGAKGAVVAVANVAPGLCAEIYRSYSAGDFNSTRRAQLQILELNRLLTSKYGVGAVKEALDLIGLPAGRPRRPPSALGRPSQGRDPEGSGGAFLNLTRALES